MPAIFGVDPRSGVPIYLQLIEQVTRAIALGTLTPGEKLPTVKALALELIVNPNTVARAYRDLERDGIISTSAGRGSFIRADGAAERAQRAVGMTAAAVISSAVREARALGLDATAVRSHVEAALLHWYGPGEPT